MKLKNKVVIITGGSSGIGKVIASFFKKVGIDVIVASRNYEEGNKTAKQLGIDFIRTDVTKLSDVKNLIRKVIKKYKKIDILVNCAGYIEPTTFEKINERIWNKTIDTNLKGTFYLIKETIPYMRKQKYGKIINISSYAGIIGSMISVPYSAAKAGIIALTKTLAKEYEGYHICINAVAPGPTNTGMIKKINPKIIKKWISSERLNKPEEIANIVLYLASSNSENINGQTIIIKGGKICQDKLKLNGFNLK